MIWDKDYDRKKYDSVIVVSSFDRKNIVAEIINIINSINNVTIVTISSSKNRSGDLLTKIKLSVDDVDTLNNTIVNIEKISDVYSIERTMK